MGNYNFSGLKFLRFLVVLFIFCLFNLSALKAQHRLILGKCYFNKLRTVTLYKGDQISVKTNKDEHYSGKISAISDSSFTVDFDEFMLHDIYSISIRKSGILLKTISSVSLLSGAGFFVLNSFNNLINSERPVFDKRVLPFSLSALSIGAVIPLFSFKKYKLAGRTTVVKILD